MKVIDHKNSEQYMQRKKTPDGRFMHCCCVCGYIDAWSGAWSWYGSLLEIDDGDAVAKFCSQICNTAGGEDAENVTDEMKKTARDNEWRPPITRYREATDAEKYNAALNNKK